MWPSGRVPRAGRGNLLIFKLKVFLIDLLQTFKTDTIYDLGKMEVVWITKIQMAFVSQPLHLRLELT